MLAAVLAPTQPWISWPGAVYLHDLARQRQRRDHAVDIAQQVWFLVTGELQGFHGTPRTSGSCLLTDLEASSQQHGREPEHRGPSGPTVLGSLPGASA
jgi:hypothetical protein